MTQRSWCRWCKASITHGTPQMPTVWVDEKGNCGCADFCYPGYYPWAYWGMCEFPLHEPQTPEEIQKSVDKAFKELKEMEEGLT